MDKQHIKGAIDKAKGAVKTAIGRMIGDRGMQVDGAVDKMKGKGRQTVGDAKDAVRAADRKPEGH
ncbi:MAG: CsbD family protein [Hyphomicrobiaceae bacterium]|nr:CsbD family protein [Hyphomicrobiaceae bacterium]